MNVNDEWLVTASIAETDRQTRAEARLAMPGGDELAGHGQSRRNPADRELARIGAQLAAARACRTWPGNWYTRPPPPSRMSPASRPI